MPVSMERIDRMAIMVRDMLRSATDAFVTLDANACELLLARDKDVDKLRDELTGDLMSAMTNTPGTVSEGLAVVFVVQSLERVGDHAKNIGEYVVTVVNGVDPRHRRSVAKALARAQANEQAANKN